MLLELIILQGTGVEFESQLADRPLTDKTRLGPGNAAVHIVHYRSPVSCYGPTHDRALDRK
jgi:hypothetical protein